MNAHGIIGLLCLSVCLIAVGARVSGQPAAAAGRGAGTTTVAAPQQVPAGQKQVPTAVVTRYQTPEERRDARLQDLESSVNELRGQIDQLRAQINGLGPATRTPVPLTPDSAYPHQDDKADNIQEVKNAIGNLWKAIELLKTDIRTVNGPGGRGR